MFRSKYQYMARGSKVRNFFVLFRDKFQLVKAIMLNFIGGHFLTIFILLEAGTRLVNIVQYVHDIFNEIQRPQYNWWLQSFNNLFK